MKSRSSIIANMAPGSPDYLVEFKSFANTGKMPIIVAIIKGVSAPFDFAFHADDFPILLSSEPSPGFHSDAIALTRDWIRAGQYVKSSMERWDKEVANVQR